MSGEQPRFDDAHIHRMLRTFTHDMRNPLVNMQVLVLQMQEALAAEDGGDAIVDELGESVTLMEESVARMNGLLQGTYELVQSMYSEPVCREVPLTVVVAEVLEVRRSQLADKGIQVKVDAAQTVWADMQAILRMLAELLDNAIRFAPEQGGRIVVDAQDHDRTMRLTVRDNGRGVEAALRERIFEPFYSNDPGRKGLGLAVVQALARAHGGQAWCEAGEGGGVSFCISLPHPVSGVPVG